MNHRQVVDKHFQDHYNYYRTICYNLYRGRYLNEDLLHESYLKFTKLPAETILKFHLENRPDKHVELRLKRIVLYIILDTHRSRHTASNRVKDGETNSSSPLFETPSVQFDYDMLASEEPVNEFELQRQVAQVAGVINKALKEPVQGNVKKSKWLKVNVFLELQNKTVNQLSKETKISRTFIKQTYQESVELIRSEIRQ